MSKVRILSPRPENSNRRKCGGFNFLFGTCGFNRQTVVCRGSNLSLDLSSKDDKSACIIVFMRTAQGLFLYTRIPSAYACVYPRIYANCADACSHILGFPRLMPVGILVVIRTALTLVLIYSDSPRLKYAGKAENAGFYIQKCTVCDFAIAPNPPKSQI